MWRALETGFSLKIYAPALDPTGNSCWSAGRKVTPSNTASKALDSIGMPEPVDSLLQAKRDARMGLRWAMLLEIGPLFVVALLDWRAAHFDESDSHARRRAVGLDQHRIAGHRKRQVVDLERHMRRRLHQIGTGCILPITLPLDAERIVLMIAHRDLQVRQVYLALEPSRGRNADMVETSSREYPHFFPP